MENVEFGHFLEESGALSFFNKWMLKIYEVYLYLVVFIL